MNKFRSIIILANLLLVVILFNKLVYDKEKILSEAQLVLLRLAPVDPRSLIQGDYMRLDYDMSGLDFGEDIPKHGYCILKLDENGVGRFIRLQYTLKPLKEDEYAIRYTGDEWNLNIGADSYFFEEGQADKYDDAVYGGMKVDRKGHNVLVGLYDEDFNKIE